ncbi:unnamed protein product, partial [Prorocentrum cordatum]
MHDEFINIRMFTKNLQCIREENRFLDFSQEFDKLQYDVAFSSETWRKDRLEVTSIPAGGQLYLSGGSMHRGVGISISSRFTPRILGVRFQPYSPRLCSLNFQLAGKLFRVVACYFPTAWDNDDVVQELYDDRNTDARKQVQVANGTIDHPDWTRRVAS